MYFCPKCNFTLDISKSNIKVDQENKIIDNVDELLKNFKKKSDLSNFTLSIDKEELLKNKSYKKLSSVNQKNLLNQLESVSSDVMFKCNNCGYSENIQKSILLYHHVVSQNENDVYHRKYTINDYKLMVKNPIYSRTKDYNCKNLKCITHTDKVDKEAIYFRNENNYQVTYVCCVCYHPWLV